MNELFLRDLDSSEEDEDYVPDASKAFFRTLTLFNFIRGTIRSRKGSVSLTL